MTRTLRLPVTEFATPVRRKGHLRAEPGDGVLSLGIEVHQKIQQRLGREQQDYRSEVRLAARFAHGVYRFKVSGRADGVFAGSPPLVEEIKSSYYLQRLRRELDDPEHPYRLQVLVYAHCYRLAFGVSPHTRLRLVSTRHGAEELLPVEPAAGFFEHWLSAKLAALAEREDQRDRRIKRRQRLAGRVRFPFAERRAGQNAAIGAVEQTVKRRKTLLLQAPTGSGKTLAVLYPALRDSLTRGAQLVFVTPKNTQFEAVIAAADALAGKGAVKVLVLKAREKRCLAAEVNCDPSVCRFAADYYDKLEQHQLVPMLARKRRYPERLWLGQGERFAVCPHALAKELIEQADLIVADYNYVFSPHSTVLARLQASDRRRRPTLLVDEFHNLYERALDYYSPQLSGDDLTALRSAVDGYPDALQGGTPSVRLLDTLAAWLQQQRPPGGGDTRLTLDPAQVAGYAHDALGLLLLAMGDDGATPRPLLTLYTRLAELAALLEEDAGVALYSDIDGGRVKLKCLDAGPKLALAYPAFYAVVGFSATLKPFAFYRDVSGLAEDIDTLELPSPFPAANRKLLVVPQVSTRYRDRAGQARRIAEAISRIAAVEPGHYCGYFPSYGFLAQVVPHLENAGLELWVQRPGTTPRDLARLAQRLRREPGCLLLGVQGGALAEGVDFQAERLRGAFIVGPALPLFDFERRQLRDYYQRRYGDGFAYAFIYPAMSRSVQAAGRIIRSEYKRGLLVLLDRRFIEPAYVRAMPDDWFEESVQELVSARILADVTAFWRAG